MTNGDMTAPRCDTQDHAPSLLYAGYGWCIPDLCYVGYDGQHFPDGWRPAEVGAPTCQACGAQYQPAALGRWVHSCPVIPAPLEIHDRSCPCEDCCR